MDGSNLVRSRRSLAIGTGTTTRRNRVLPAASVLSQIPQRVGSFQQRDNSTTAPAEPPCLGSDFWTYTAGYPWHDHAWHTDPDTLVSSDGILRMDRTAIKRMSVVGLKPSLSTDPIHLCFASPTVASQDQPGAGPNDIMFRETAYSARQWHPAQTISVLPLSVLGAVQRLKSITWRQGGTTYTFAWEFKTDTDAAEPTTATPTCMNRPSRETRTADRLFANDGTVQPRRRVKQFQLVNREGRGYLEVRDVPWGFMPATTRADVALLVNAAWASESNHGNVTDLSRLLSIGQGYHGLCAPGSIKDLSGNNLAKPASMAAPRYGNTRYFRSPTAPGTPAPGLLPPDYATAGYEFREDAVLGSGLDYGPGSPILPTVTAWLHVDSAGVVSVLDLVLINDTAATTTWQVVRYDQPPGSPQYLTYTILGSFDLTTTDAYLLGLPEDQRHVRIRTGSYDYQITTSGADDKPQSPPGVERANATALHLQKYLQVEPAPDGRTIAVLRGWYDADHPYLGTDPSGNQSIIATVATVTISASGSVGTPSVLFQYAHTWNAAGPCSIYLCHGCTFRDTGALHLWTSTQALIYNPPDHPQPGHQREIGSLSFSGPTLVAAADLWFGQTQIWRATNNVLLCGLYYAGTDVGFGRPPVLSLEFSTPTAAYDYATTMESGSSTGRYATWNPKTWQFAARKSGPITWV